MVPFFLMEKKKKKAYRCSYTEMVRTIKEWGHREAPNMLKSLNSEQKRDPFHNHILYLIGKSTG